MIRNEVRQREFSFWARTKSAGKKNIKKPGSSPGMVKTGIGCAAYIWPAGGGSRSTQGEAQINPDGSIEVRLGVQDIGTGTKTAFIAIVAAEILWPQARPNYRKSWRYQLSSRPGKWRQYDMRFSFADRL